MTQQMRRKKWDESGDQKATPQISVVSLTRGQPLRVDIKVCQRR